MELSYPQKKFPWAWFYWLLRMLAVVVGVSAAYSTGVGCLAVPLLMVLALLVVVAAQPLLQRDVLRRYRSLPDLDLSSFPELESWFGAVCEEYNLRVVLKDGVVDADRAVGTATPVLGESFMPWGSGHELLLQSWWYLRLRCSSALLDHWQRRLAGSAEPTDG